MYKVVGYRMGLIVLFLAMPAAILRAQHGGFLTDEEEDALREEQDPSGRIAVYLTLAQTRLTRIEEFRHAPQDPKYDNGAYLDKLMGEYISLTDELKNWIQDQYDRRGDMRRGLRSLLEVGPKQLEALRRIQQSPDPYAADYANALRDAIDDLSDALDGATTALAGQEKKFGQMKREEKADARAAKQREKEEKKQTKEEKKLRKQQHKRGVPADTDQD